ncbi:hypothetical protein LCM10_18515 [Rossellomorea aquimaris]|uniref:hypothetical protein n=1 Tax=Rossellomorea aquimaris TaxID=189382 RepID=UPI001CD30799|nr:hypothetical protein [Rossellomorea aquimaris]MCA1056960.1 hypothetical protein [Rossellomorea aquimaris]
MNKIPQKKFEKFFKEALDNNEKKMSLFCHQERINSFVIEGKRVKFQSILVVYSRGDLQICFGQIGEQQLFYSSDKSCKDNIYLIIDQSKNKKRLHINFNDQFITHSEKDLYDEREIILTYVENQNFAQLQVYDSLLKYNKFSEYFADTSSTIASARCLAFGHLMNTIPDIAYSISGLYESGDEIDHE